MSKKAESQIREAIATDIRQSGGWAIITSGSIKTAQGTPDIIASVPCRDDSGQFYMCAIEVKTENGDLSILQAEVLERMGKRGFAVFIPTSLRNWHTQFKNFAYRNEHG